MSLPVSFSSVDNKDEEIEAIVASYEKQICDLQALLFSHGQALSRLEAQAVILQEAVRSHDRVFSRLEDVALANGNALFELVANVKELAKHVAIAQEIANKRGEPSGEGEKK